MLLATIKNVDQLIFELVKLGYKRGTDLDLNEDSSDFADFNTYSFSEPFVEGYPDVVYAIHIAPKEIIREGAWKAVDEDKLRSSWFLEALYYVRDEKKKIFHWRLVKLGGDIELYMVVPSLIVYLKDLDEFIKYKIRMIKEDVIKESF